MRRQRDIKEVCLEGINLTISTEKYKTNRYNSKTSGNDNPWTVFRGAVRSNQTLKMDLW